MKLSWFSLFALTTLMGTFLAPATKADPLYKRTEVTFNQPVEIPGMVLMPGKYVIKLLDPYMERNVVRFYNPQENHMYAMVLAVPDYRMTATDHTVFTFEERAHKAPPALKEWFPAGENWGTEFVYSKPTPLAASAAPAVSQTIQSQAAIPAPSPTSEATRIQPVAPVAQVEPQQLPVEVAQNQSTPATSNPPAPETETTETKELPKTASELPLATLLGGAFVFAGAILRRRGA